MKLINIAVSGIFENVYLYFDEYNKTGVIIDPGGEAEKILQTIEDYGIHVAAILLTHGHYDHIAAVNAVATATGAPVYAHTEEVTLLADSTLNLSQLSLNKSIAIIPDIYVNDGDILRFDGLDAEIRVIHTPGHTGGSVCYLDLENFVLFSGDTLFFESIGRTDFPTGNKDAIIASIKDRLFGLSGDIVVYPGHYHKTNIKHEKNFNPYVN